MVQRNKASLIQLDEIDNRYVASRFNVRTYDDEQNLLLYNSYTGQLITILQVNADSVVQILDKGTTDLENPIVQELIKRGYLVESTVDEFRRANLQHKESLFKNRTLNLILLPNENCNFRCVYCYESFAKNKMNEQTQKGVVEYVRKEIDKYDKLQISWFGGEPLTAIEIVESLSKELIRICIEKGKKYAANMTTNGYLLKLDVFERLLKLGVRTYQITFDGTEETHDRHRILAHGGATFDTIFSNLVAIQKSNLKNFNIVIRSNIDEDNKPYMAKYNRLMAENFGNDNRFTNHFVPVQKLGGDNDTNIHLCDTKDILPLIHDAMDVGLDFSLYRQTMHPYGNVCYAAKPSSFVIGSDGMVYKCTVAFDDERNHVGNLLSDGTMELYYDRLALWLANGAMEDSACQKCYFRPSCQGEACPLERIEHGKTPCPPIKKNLKAYMKLLAKDKHQPVLEFPVLSTH